MRKKVKKKNGRRFIALVLFLVILLFSILKLNSLNFISKSNDSIGGISSGAVNGVEKIDKIYLDYGNINWGDWEPNIYFEYMSAQNGKTRIKLTEWVQDSLDNNKNYLECSLPDDFDKESSFNFIREKPDGSKDWNSVQNIYLDGTNNVFTLSGWNAGSWRKYFYDGETGEYSNKKMAFANKSQEDLTEVKAIFYKRNEQGNLDEVADVSLGNIGSSKVISFNIPYAVSAYVKFVDGNNNVLGVEYSNFTNEDDTVDIKFLYNESTAMCYTYDGTNGEWSSVPSRNVYFDATLSKLPYDDEVTNGKKNNTIPLSSGSTEGNTVYAHIWDSSNESDNYNVELDKLADNVVDNNTYKDVYSVEIPINYDKILFYGSNNINSIPFSASNKTEDLTIPNNLDNPCFYADTSDNSIYSSIGRSGYWGEVYTIRNAEYYKNTDVVDIRTGNYEEDLSKLYVNTTLYDYYSDYELNGFNRDNMGSFTAGNRSWVQFRQLNQALSDYYSNSNVNIPLYMGHFQPTGTDESGYTYEHIFENLASTLKLYGYKQVGVYGALTVSQKEFMSVHNSNFDSTENKIKNLYDAAAQGLVYNSLINNELMTSGNEISLPYFNEDFIEGNNSKNVVLGEVYNNVSFPFTNQTIDNINYWVYNSNDTSLEMKYDENKQKYYLNESTPTSNSKNISADNGGTYGYFPFNNNTSGQMSRYNYGFGSKFDIEFSLTDNRKVEDINGNEVPIEYTFSGDDDIWIFVDDNLALDMGGAHGKVTGTLNFATMKATVSKTKVNPGSDVAGENITTDFTLKENVTTHKLTVYYMERGMWESNMEIRFNLPEVNNTADVTVKAEWEDEDEKTDSVEVELWRYLIGTDGNIIKTEQLTEETITLSDTNNWIHVYEDIPKYLADNSSNIVGYYKYFVKQTSIEGYSTDYTNNAGIINDTIVIKNDIDQTQTKDIKYTVEYYKEGILDNSATHDKTITVQVLEDDILDVDKTSINILNKYDGYKLQKIEKDDTVISSLPDSVEDGTVIKVYYIKKDAKVIVNHILVSTDTASQDTVLETKTINGKVGDEYNVSTIDITGYVPVDNQAPQTGNMTENDIIINYYYNQISSGVVEKHIDITTDELLEQAITHEGIVGDDYSIASKTFTGYDLVQEQLPTNSAGKMEVDLIEVKYYYVRQASVVAKYIDIITGDEIPENDSTTGANSSREVKTGHVGDSYTTTEKTFDGYVLVQDKYPENSTGKMAVVNDENGNLTTETVVKYYYVHKSGGVIEKHINITTGELMETQTEYQGNEGDAYSIASKTFDDYDLVEEKIPENAKGTMTIDKIEVKYYYIKKSKVTIQYIDKDTGKAITEDAIINGHVGDSYNIGTKSFDGYNYISVDGTTEGELGNENLVVKYYYEKKKENASSNDTAKTDESRLANSGTSLDNKTQEENTTKKKNQETKIDNNPKTGDTIIYKAIGAIVVVIILNVILVVVRKSKKKTKRN